MPIFQFEDMTPQIAPTAWLAPGVQAIGQVRIDALASIWFGTIIRADNGLIHIGEGSNIQDACMLHNAQGHPLIIEPNVSVGHQVMLHGCHVEQGTLIGMSSVLLSGSRIGRNSLVGAGSLVTERKTFPDGVLIFGRPAKVIRELTAEEIALLQTDTHNYITKAQRYARRLAPYQNTLKTTPENNH